jgi:hypothetical protein
MRQCLTLGEGTVRRTRSRKTTRALKKCKLFSGERLDYPLHSFDIVMFNWVLHHANDNTIQLLQDARRICRRVIVSEDLKGESIEELNAEFAHERQGTYRGIREWEALFRMIGFSIDRGSSGSVIKRCAHSVPRYFWVLHSNETYAAP